MKCNHISATVGIYQVTRLQEKCRTRTSALYLCRPFGSPAFTRCADIKFTSNMRSWEVPQLLKVWRRCEEREHPASVARTRPPKHAGEHLIKKKSIWPNFWPTLFGCIVCTHTHTHLTNDTPQPSPTFVLVNLKVKSIHIIPLTQPRSFWSNHLLGGPGLDPVSKDAETNVPHWDGWRCQTLED